MLVNDTVICCPGRSKTPEPILPSGPPAFLRYVCFEDPDGTVIELVEYLD